MEHWGSPVFPQTPVLAIYSESIHISTVSSDPFKCFLSKNVCIIDDQSFSNNQGQFSNLWHLLPQAHETIWWQQASSKYVNTETPLASYLPKRKWFHPGPPTTVFSILLYPPIGSPVSCLLLPYSISYTVPHHVQPSPCHPINYLFNILILKLFKGILQSSACNISHTTVSFRCSTCHIVLVPSDFILSDTVP